jgi:hypothetical protein
MDIKIRKSNPSYKNFQVGRIHILPAQAKSGKTTAVSTWGDEEENPAQPATLVLCTEVGGADYVRSANSVSMIGLFPPEVEDSSSPTGYREVPPIERGAVDENGNPYEVYAFVEVLDWLKENWKTLGYKNLAIDPFDNFVQWVDEFTLETIKAADKDAKEPKYQDATHISEIEFAVGTSKSRAKVQEKVLELLDIVRNTGCLLLPCHLENTITIRAGKQVIPQQKISGVPDKLARWLNGMAETICYLQKTEDGKYTASFDGYGETLMGSRLEPLKGKTVQFSKSGKFSLYNQLLSLMRSYDPGEEQPEVTPAISPKRKPRAKAEKPVSESLGSEQPAAAKEEIKPADDQLTPEPQEQKVEDPYENIPDTPAQFGLTDHIQKQDDQNEDGATVVASSGDPKVDSFVQSLLNNDDD